MSTTSLPAPVLKTPKKRFRAAHFKEQLTGYLFILPAFAIISIFGFFPIGYAVYMSTFRWRVRKGDFIGLGNYTKALGDWLGALIFVVGLLLLLAAYLVWMRKLSARGNRLWAQRAIALVLLVASLVVISNGWGRMIATGDPDFLTSLPKTLFYALGTVPAELGIALVLAYILFQKIRGQEFFRMLYFLPYITPMITKTVIFRAIFSPRETSLANIALSWVGIEPQKWLFEPQPINNLLFDLNMDGFLAGPSLALVSIIFFGIWTYVGYNTVIFLAGLGSIPGELYEAAEIDGANQWQLFRHITIPLLSPVTFYLALIAFIGTFKAFNHIYVMRVPSAQGTVDVTSVTIFDTFYKANQYGYAAAQAILLFIIILGLTLVQNKVFGEKVFYE
ncbi:MAG TPA: sugar ABC transporter permease [Anaerolineales bacterium]|nr:sugar ABC transporter permease [Anaerolineales bacterium]